MMEDLVTAVAERTSHVVEALSELCNSNHHPTFRGGLDSPSNVAFGTSERARAICTSEQSIPQHIESGVGECLVAGMPAPNRGPRIEKEGKFGHPGAIGGCSCGPVTSCRIV